MTCRDEGSSGNRATLAAVIPLEIRRIVRRALSGIRVAVRWVWARFRRFVATLSVGGMIMALLFFCFSMTPSLLPRAWFLQGVASGICMLTGYAVGVLISWLLRAFGFRPLSQPKHRRVVSRVLWISAAVLVPAFGVLGAIWQYRVRVLSAVDPSDSNYYALVLLISFTLARLLLALARGLRVATRRIGHFGSRWIPPPVAKLVATVMVAVLVVTAFADALVPALLAAANSSFSLADYGTPEGVVRPSQPERSGSPASFVRWEDLGSEGRRFVGTGPSRAEIEAFTGEPASEPIRVYAGLHSVDRADDSLTAEAELVVHELVRTGAFDRAVLVVATTTGRGWVNNVAASAVEYLWGGDTAIAAMQYSYLSSLVAFLTDRETPPTAAEELLTAITRERDSRPVGSRPTLIVMGESLGAYGSQGSFASLADLDLKVDGAIWAGTPSMTKLWADLTAKRDAGSPQQIPVIDGCAVVCFADRPSDIPLGANPKVVYLQHVDDPVVWWSPDLLLRRPSWLAEPPLPGRTAEMRYIPLVTFWQLATDMAVSTEMPDGFGHEYALAYVDAFAAVIPPPGWRPRDTARLRGALAAADSGG